MLDRFFFSFNYVKCNFKVRFSLPPNKKQQQHEQMYIYEKTHSNKNHYELNCYLKLKKIINDIIFNLNKKIRQKNS